MSLSSFLLVALGASIAGAVLGAAAVLGLLWAWPHVERWFFARFEAYQRDVRRTQAALPFPAERQIADAELAEYVRLRQQFQVAGEIIDEQIARRQHVLAGGEINDSPTRWRKGEVSK